MGHDLDRIRLAAGRLFYAARLVNLGTAAGDPAAREAFYERARDVLASSVNATGVARGSQLIDLNAPVLTGC